jgi:hypothetical protein
VAIAMTLPDRARSAVECGEHVRLLERERAIVLANPIAYNGDYVDDLDDELREARRMYTIAAVVEIARFRASVRTR